MRWWIPFNNLRPIQQAIINGVTNNPNRPHWIKGFAGTGKSLILMNLMERMASLHPQASLCFITYTNSLLELVKSAPVYHQILNHAVIQTYREFLNNGKKFNYVFLDEVQDINLADLNRIKTLADHLYFAGDSEQRIYCDRITENEINAQIRPEIHELREVFRLTPQLCKVARSISSETQLVEGFLEKGNPDAPIKLLRAANVDDESAWVWREAIGRATLGNPSVILFPRHDDLYKFAKKMANFLQEDIPPQPHIEQGRRNYAPFNNYWQNKNLPLMFLGNGFGELLSSDNRPLVYLMTFHSAKGLDFKNVFIPGLNDDLHIVPKKALKKNSRLDRRLLFVAVTRSRENLFLSYSGDNLHHLLLNLPPEHVTKGDIPPLTLEPADTEEFF